jgi:hypothetical protein
MDLNCTVGMILYVTNIHSIHFIWVGALKMQKNLLFSKITS